MILSKTEQIIGAVINFFAINLFIAYLTLGSFGVGGSALYIFGTLCIGIGIFCFFTLRYFRRQNQFEAIDYLNVSTQRYLLGLFMIFYGASKLSGNFFDYQLSALDTKLKDISEFELAWYFFGKNNWQELFIGILEFVPGILLFFRRTYYKAAIILLPVTGQVFVLNFFFRIGGITFPAATILLACDIYIIYSQKEKIKAFFKSLDFYPELRLGGSARFLIKFFKWAIYVCVLLVLFMNVHTIFKSRLELKYEKIVGAYTFKSMKKNHADYIPVSDSACYKDLYIEKQARWNILRRFNDSMDAFVLKINDHNDSVSIYINKGGIGDDPDIIDSSSVLTGVYSLRDNRLIIQGVQGKDTLELQYIKRDIKPKSWIW